MHTTAKETMIAKETICMIICFYRTVFFSGMLTKILFVYFLKIKRKNSIII